VAKKLQAVHHRRKVLIAGGGVAALEAMMELRSLVGGTVQIELLAPEVEFSYRPIAVAEPFGLGEVRRYELAAIAADHAAHLRRGTLADIEPSRHTVWTSAEEELAYDFLVVAVGATARPAIDGALTFGGAGDRDALRQVLDGAQTGKVRRLVFAAPPAVGWLLPIYELALFTAAWGLQHDVPFTLSLVTHEDRPLEAFGSDASATVNALLDDAGIKLLTNAVAREFDGRRLTVERSRSRAQPIQAEAVISLPGLEGPYLAGLPHDEHGFIPTDAHGAVESVKGVYAAGDATTFPIKQGGLAAQQADAVAEAIAAELGVLQRPAPFRPVLRGLLLSGSEPRYLRARVGGEIGLSSEVAFRPLWWPPSKIAGRQLAPYLADPNDPTLMRTPLEDRPAPEVESSEEVAADEQEAIELLLELADANARRGSYSFALKCLDAAEDVGGPLPERRVAERRKWAKGSRKN
jgi:sulfide:quinone oxidoreductase